MINLAVSVMQGDVCSTTWSAHKTNLPIMGPNGPTGSTVPSEGFQGEISTRVANVSSDLEINLGSTDAPAGTPTPSPAMFIDTPYGTIPISFCDASSFNVQVGNVSYVNGLPTVINTITFNNIAVPTYGGQGPSSINFVISQTFIANWTNMIVSIGVYADFSNMKLYQSDGTPIPSNTDFSFNLMYQIDMNNGVPLTDSTQPYDYPPSDVTPTSVFFAVNSTSGTQLSIADMNFGGAYTDIQGSNRLSSEPQTPYFQYSDNPPGNWEVNCFQSFPNLTYGVTTAVQSDPTFTVQHNLISAGWGPIGSLIIYVAFIGGIVAVAVVGTVIFVRRRKK